MVQVIKKLVCIFSMTVFFVACGDSESKNDPGSASNSGNSSGLSRGFANNCASCHGPAGGGGSAKSIQRYSGSLSSFSSTVRAGKGSMPAVTSSNYTDTDLNADYSYLKSL